MQQLHEHVQRELAPDSPPSPSPEPASADNPLAAIWSALLKWSAALITFGGLALHVAGYIYHSEYVKAFGLDADLFPKSVEWILICGYKVVLLGLFKLWVFFTTEWWKLAAWGLVVGTLAWIGVCALVYGQEQIPKRILRRAVKGWPKWLLAGVFSYGYMAFVCLSIAVAPIVAVAFIFLPAQLAIEQAAEDAQSQLAKYTEGCPLAEPARRCVTLRREGKPELQGFLIDSSDKLLALYLPAQNQVQVIERDKVEISVGLAKGKT
ncbi:hypothetical protein Q9Q94_08935 [Uliginosibacterium sp. 31-16]|uniref:hypothetical protein n=1 Tax=Uliginosibacterium sp. 31-16 TaxID=3068315 RepID=UPI00273F1F7B|nr:hypothetical protein [Uliginosibacterium sp. 31-16]MDP5239653.1 hypothetical protein [Uliginosibacterium sp. 31-16]